MRKGVTRYIFGYENACGTESIGDIIDVTLLTLPKRKGFA